jgi:redox-sensitive bicupin YhaK (pirin superfamily)
LTGWRNIRSISSSVDGEEFLSGEREVAKGTGDECPRSRVMTSTPSRSVRARHEAMRDDIGDLVTRRPLPGGRVQQISPFLFLNHHGPQVYGPNNHGLPFGPHPHRGFETVTFILQGSLAHHDSGGHSSVIEPGGVQWMTAGSGLVHAEVSPPSFKEQGGSLEILQLWVNLPSQLKMTEPRYSGVQRAEIPQVAIAGTKGRLNLISGEFRGTRGPINSLTNVFMSTIELDPGASVSLPAPRERGVFLYVVDGEGTICDTEYSKWQLIEFDDNADAIEMHSRKPTVLLFGHGTPIDEPVVSHGPFVMNTRQEIIQAYQDYHAGKFNREDALPEVGI